MEQKAREMAVRILKNAGCTEEDYRGRGVDEIINDLKAAFPDGISDGFTYEDIADAIYAISTTDVGWKEPIHYQFDGIYASHWGVTDLKDSVREDLQRLVSTGEPFLTDELSSKKELCSWSMSRELVRGPIAITVNQWMDDGAELVYDALPDGVEISDDEIDEILEAWSGCDCGSETSEEAVVAGDSSLDAILEKVSELLQTTTARLDEWFELLKGTIRGYSPELMEE